MSQLSTGAMAQKLKIFRPKLMNGLQTFGMHIVPLAVRIILLPPVRQAVQLPRPCR